MRPQTNAVELALLLTLPAAVGAGRSAAPPFTPRSSLGGGSTPPTRAITGAGVAALVVGLPAYVLVKVLTPSFFAREDTRTPVCIAAGRADGQHRAQLRAVVPRFGIVGLAAATRDRRDAQRRAALCDAAAGAASSGTRRAARRRACAPACSRRCDGRGAVVALPLLAGYVQRRHGSRGWSRSAALVGAAAAVVFGARRLAARRRSTAQRLAAASPPPAILMAIRAQSNARRFRHPAHRQSPSRQLPRRDPQLGADAGRACRRGGQCLFFLADLHAISMPHDPAELRRGDARDGRGAGRLRDRSRRARSCSTRRRFPRMPSCNGCSTAPRGWAG